MMKDPYLLNLTNLKQNHIETELENADDLIKSDLDNPNIGIILCRDKDKISVEYALKDINKPIGVISYEISKVLPKEVLGSLPTEEDLNLHINVQNDKIVEEE